MKNLKSKNRICEKQQPQVKPKLYRLNLMTAYIIYTEIYQKET